MKPLRAFESALVRIEGAVAVALVLTMLALAGYNVFYRNVLVPLQKHWAHSGAVVVAEAVVAAPVTESDAKAGGEAPTPAPAKDDGAEGFGGDWGEDGDAPAPAPAPAPEPEPAPSKPPAADDGAEGFGGDWGEDEGGPAEPAPTDDAKSAVAAVGDDELSDELADEDDPFANLQRIEGVGVEAGVRDGEPEGGPPPEGSFAAWAVAAIDAIKMGWIDVVLRQLVILVAFFGGMLATHRGKHINVDALSKMLPPGVRRLLGVITNALALAVCVVLARAGAQLVAISREHPRELVPWADEWVFQLMYPLGFGLLAFHFTVRVAEALAGLPPPGEAEREAAELPIAPQGSGGGID